MKLSIVLTSVLATLAIAAPMAVVDKNGSGSGLDSVGSTFGSITGNHGNGDGNAAGSLDGANGSDNEAGSDNETGNDNGDGNASSDNIGNPNVSPSAPIVEVPSDAVAPTVNMLRRLIPSIFERWAKCPHHDDCSYGFGCCYH